MLFLCRNLHFTESYNGLSVFCKQCNKTFEKCKMYKFLKVNGGWYLHQQSKEALRYKRSKMDGINDYQKRYMRRYRLMKKQKSLEVTV